MVMPPNQRYKAVAPEPVNWWDRIRSLGGIGPGRNILPMARMYRDALPDMWANFRDTAPQQVTSVNPLTGEFWRSALEISKGQAMPVLQRAAELPAIKALGTWGEIVEPGAAAAFANVPGLRKPGVVERQRQLREAGYGPLESVQAAYRQAKGAGEIPWWQSAGVEAVLDPVELIPGVGIAGGVTKLGLGAGRAGLRAATGVAAREAAEAAAEAAAREARVVAPMLEATPRQVGRDVAGLFPAPPKPPMEPVQAPLDPSVMARTAQQLEFPPALDPSPRFMPDQPLFRNLGVQSQFPEQRVLPGMLEETAERIGMDPSIRVPGMLEEIARLDPMEQATRDQLQRWIAGTKVSYPREVFRPQKGLIPPGRTPALQAVPEGIVPEGIVPEGIVPEGPPPPRGPAVPEGAIPEDVRPPAPPSRWNKFMQQWHDKYWVSRGFRGGVGALKRIKPDKADEISELNFNVLVNQHPQIGPMAMIEADDVQKIAGVRAPGLAERKDFIDLVGKMQAIRHAPEVFMEFPGRNIYGQYKKADFEPGGLLDTELKNLGRDAAESEQLYQELTEAADEFRLAYKKIRDENVAEGFYSQELSDLLQNRYPWYSPIHLIDRDYAPGEISRWVQDAKIPLKRLTEEGTEGLLANPMETLRKTLISHKHRILTNKIKRTMIEDAKYANHPGLREITDPSEAARLLKGAADVGDIPLERGGIKGEINYEAMFRRKEDPKNALSYFDPNEPGVKKVVEVGEDLYNEAQFLYHFKDARNILTGFNSWRKALLVSYNPAFALANTLNDTLVAFFSRGIMPWQSFSKLKKTLLDMQTDPLGRLYMVTGGRGKFYEKDPLDAIREAAGDPRTPWAKAIKDIPRMIKGRRAEEYSPAQLADDAKVIKDAGGDPSTATEAVRKINAGWNRFIKQPLERVGQSGELAPRMVAFENKMNELAPGWADELYVLRPGKWLQRMGIRLKVRTPRDKLPVSDPDYRTPIQMRDEVYRLSELPAARAAVNDATEATINFSRGGSKIKMLNDYILFLNPAMEGMKMLYRPGQAQGYLRYSSRLASVSAGQLGLTYYNMQYPEYFDIPLHERLTSVVVMLPSSEKDSYGNPVPRRVNIIPKTREFSVLLGSATYMMEKLYADSPVETGTFIKTLIPEVTPLSMTKTGFPLPPLPEAAESTAEIITGYDFYRNRDIVPEHLKNLPAPEQYQPWTSPVLKDLSDSFGDQVPDSLESPIMLDKLFETFGGGVLREGLNAVDLIYDLIKGGSEPTIQELADEYDSIDSAVDRKSYMTALTPEQRKDVLTEVERPTRSIGGVFRKLPGLGGMGRRVYKDYGGEIRRTKAEVAARETETDIDQTRNAGSELRSVRDDQLEKKKRAGTTVNLIDQSPSGISDRILWREAHKKTNALYEGALVSVKLKYPKSIQAADVDTRRRYYEIQPTVGEDTRTRGQVLLSEYYSIQPQAEGLTEQDIALGLLDFDLFYEEREQFKDSLSPSDKKLLDAEINAGRTEVEKRYYSDVDAIRASGFWEVMPVLVENYGLGGQWEKYKSLRGIARSEFIKSDEAKIPGMQIGLKEVISYASKVRDKMRMDNPELEQKLLYWGFYQTPAIEKVSTRRRLGI